MLPPVVLVALKPVTALATAFKVVPPSETVVKVVPVMAPVWVIAPPAPPAFAVKLTVLDVPIKVTSKPLTSL